MAAAVPRTASTQGELFMKKFAIILALALTIPAFAGDEKAGHAGKHAEHHGEAGKSCEMMKNAEGTPVETDGTMLCRKCDLHETEKCEKVFQMAGDDKKLVPICSGSKVDLEELSQHGGSKLHVKGKMVKCGEDGKDELYIEEATKL
jgi:hypothetical protein